MDCKQWVLPPIAALIDRLPGVRLHADPYQGPFEAYHHLATGAQTWDLPATLAAAAAHPGRVLDLGCGRGRLTLPLARAGHRVTAVDTSAGALRHLRAAVAADTGLTDRVVIVTADAVNPAALPAEAFSTVAIGDLTVNTFASGAAVDRLFGSIRRMLAPGGVLTMPVLDPSAVPTYERMRGMTVTAFPGDDGVERLMWLVLRFDAEGPFFRRTLFVQDVPDQEGRVVAHATAVRERLWTTESLDVHLRAAGLTVLDAAPAGPVPTVVLTVGAA